MIRKKHLFIVLSLFLGLFLFQNCMMTFRVPNEKILETFKEASVPIKIKRGKFKGRDYQYFEVSSDNSQTKPIVLLVHGAPGSADEFRNFLLDRELSRKATIISVDRFGYGYSGYGNSEPSLKKQAALLHHILRRYKKVSVIAAGHSYGGPILTRMAIDYPDDLNGLILVAPAEDPDCEKYTSIAKFGKWKATKWVVSTPFQVAADEKLVHINELKKMESLLPQIAIPVIHIHGKKDKVVPYENVTYSKEHFNKNVLQTLSLEEKGHFLLSKENYVIVKDKIISLLNRAQSLPENMQ